MFGPFAKSGRPPAAARLGWPRHVRLGSLKRSVVIAIPE